MKKKLRKEVVLLQKLQKYAKYCNNLFIVFLNVLFHYINKKNELKQDKSLANFKHKIILE